MAERSGVRQPNRQAQRLFGYGWEEFTRLPSRLSAEPVSQEERQRLLDEARSKGYIDDGQGIRIARDGTRFRIENVILWNVTDDHGNSVGQAAIFDRWTRLEGQQPADSGDYPFRRGRLERGHVTNEHIKNEQA